VGIGRGALADVSPTLVNNNAWAAYTENLPSQWLIDWGVPVTIVVVALFVTSIIRSPPRRKHEAALACGLIALIVQNLVDYSLEIAGISSVAAVALGVLVSRERPLTKPAWARLRPIVSGSVVTAATAVLFAAPVLSRDAPLNVRSRLEEMLTTDAQGFDEALSAGFRQYPLDPALVVLASAQAVRAARPDAVRWLNLSLRVAPDWTAPHLHAAYLLERLGRVEQAAIELSLIAKPNHSDWYQPACDFIRRHGRADLALATVPIVPDRGPLLEHALRCIAANIEEAERVAQAMIAEFPKLVSPHVFVAEAAHVRGDDAKTLAELNEAIRLHPAAEGWAPILSLLHRSGRGQEALRLYRDLPLAARQQRNVISTAAGIAAATRDMPLLQSLVAENIRLHGTTVATRAEREALASQLFTTAGQPFEALVHAQAAFEANGTPELAELTHAAALRANMPGVALRMASELCHVAYRNRWYCANPTLPAR
jgi:tetratricopeptide (TPR) repeat protein